MTSPRPPYGHAALRRLLHPRSVAVLGASPRPGSFGLRTLHNLAGFAGPVYAVNPRHAVIEGRPCLPDLAALPEAPDCVVVTLGRDAVEAAVADCVARGVGGVVLYASGYAETRRPDLAAQQARLVALVAGTGTRLLGPNCLGFANYACGARLLFGRMPAPRPPGPAALGIVSQSGSVAMALAQAMDRGVPVSHALPVGNAADVGIADLVAYLAEDPACHAILAAFEGVAAPRLLADAVRIATAAGKPVVVHKAATGEAGAAAALSHTGALAGSHAAYRALLEAAGAVLVDDMEDLVETGLFFAKAGRPTGRGVGIVIGSGGLGVAAADKAEQHGVPLPQPEGATLALLQARVPEFGAARNPCDVTAQTLNDDGVLADCAGAFLADPAYSALVTVHTYADAFGSSRIPLWRALAARHGKIICNHWATEALEGPGARELEAEPGIATFRSLGRCMRAIAAWHARADRQAARAGRARLTVPQPLPELAAATAPLLTEGAAKALLARYGIPVVREIAAGDAEAAAVAAAAIGFPVALKLESPDLPHKTEAGVVALGLRDAAAVRAAHAALLARAAARSPPPRLTGALVQAMVPVGLELVMGATCEPGFGPLVMFGLGGVMVELLQDTALLPAPFAPAEALAALRGLRAARAFAGFRGLPAVDLPALAVLLARFSEFVADHAASIAEIDVNPLICRGAEMVAVDALLVRRVAGATG